MYRNEDEFVRGQKIKIALTVILLAIAFLSGCGEPAWRAELREQCAAWRSMSRTHSDSLNVTMNCASIAAAHEARDAANDAGMLAAGAMGMAAGANANAAAAMQTVPR